MGNWQLEVFKLGLFVSFPVGMFYFYNQAQYFEDWVIKMKRELYPPDDLTCRQELQDFIKEMRQKQQSELIAKMQAEMDQSTRPFKMAL
ncbi:protein PET100 homolog, mitochondrial-like [Folsomia candida]|uniref:protein PET100 homolog, mitochondrial-like n=1 Tax=Folsomia candida TaxID=158441 RepID=UPI001604DFDD|nr:protein PET100 homolog, mitochondrial-like [Folsomia candida]